MVIIQLAGGLGNQMFQYALYLQFQNLHKEVKIDDVAGFVEDEKRDPSLSAFGITYQKADPKEIEEMLDASLLFWHRVRRKLFGRKRKSYFEADKRFKPEIFTWDDIYLEGYWQTEKYFEAVADQVRAAFDVDRLLMVQQAEDMVKAGRTKQQTKVQTYLRQITQTQSVSLHIRRGDYLTPENQALFGGICTEAYYKEAVRLMRKQYPGCRFFLFTNDKEWAKERFADDKGGRTTETALADGEPADVIVVDLPEGSDHEEFALMSKCKHHILANSSFSWWASYLNQNPGKTVLAPPKWLNGWDCQDFYREDMRKVSVTP
ncbi:MAG: alpha-1,2-fucosyltransferase [Lachnospiraceae bacterium]|nr:alpha-1,2-fucosyltransferase [Lachnospiraceae bacterium]